MKYQCQDCKDTGVIVLLLTRQPCDCRRATEPSPKLSPFDGYERYVSGRLHR